MSGWRKTSVCRSSCEGSDGVCPNLADWTKEDVGLCNDCKMLLETGPLPPLKWRNDDCQTDYDVLRRCEPCEQEAPVATHGEIITLLSSGWPICPECGSDMTCVEN